jgi:hypothetical protein
MSGKVVNGRTINGEIEILIDGDPFPVMVARAQVTQTGGSETTMTTTARQTTAKELRRQAKNAGVEGYMEMSREELVEALGAVNGGEEAAASRTTRKPASNGTGRARRTKPAEAPAEKPARAAKATKATKSTAKATEKADGPNPFRSGTNLWHITEALMRGGKRSDLVAKLRTKLSFNPRVKSEDEFDVDLEIDRRLKVIGYLLKNQHGWEFTHEGRGSDAYIKVAPPA